MATRRSSLENTIYKHPGFLARRLQQIAVGIFLEETARFGITPVQYGLLAAVQAEPGIDQISAGDRIGLDRTTVADSARRIARKGWLRLTVDREDRRVRRLHLTASGKRLLRDLAPVVARAQRRILDPLDSAARRQLCASIARVVQHHNAAARVRISSSQSRN
jgi:MarR family transcriptional regulator, lower aerobic nicotinate degradation pathway regulator